MNLIDTHLSERLIGFLRSFCKEIQKKNLSPLFLRGYENLPRSCGFDIDLLVDRKHISSLKKLFKNIAAKERLWYCFLPNQIGGMKCAIFQISHEDKIKRKWLLFDIQEKVFFSDELTFSTEKIQMHYLTIDDFNLLVPTPEWLFLLYFIDALRKNKIGSRRKLLIDMFKSNAHEICTLLKKEIPELNEKDVHELLKDDSQKKMMTTCELLSIKPWFKTKKPKSNIRNRLSQFIFYKLFFIHIHHPIFITINGADGVGKTTAVKLTEELFSQYPIPFTTFHHISEWKNNRGQNTEKNSSNEKKEPEKLSVFRKVRRFVYWSSPSFVRQLWIGINDEINYAIQVNRLIGRAYFKRKIILIDRYIYDRHIKMQFVEKTKLQKTICRLSARFLIRKPMYNIFIEDEPERIHLRKQELTVNSITKYQQLFKEYCNNLALNLINISVKKRPPEEISNEIIEKMLNKISEFVIPFMLEYEKSRKT